MLYGDYIRSFDNRKLAQYIADAITRQVKQITESVAADYDWEAHERAVEKIYFNAFEKEVFDKVNGKKH